MPAPEETCRYQGLGPMADGGDRLVPAEEIFGYPDRRPFPPYSLRSLSAGEDEDIVFSRVYLFEGFIYLDLLPSLSLYLAFFQRSYVHLNPLFLHAVIWNKEFQVLEIVSTEHQGLHCLLLPQPVYTYMLSG